MADSVNNLEELKRLAPPAELRRAPVVEGRPNLGALTDKLSAFAEGKTPVWWWIFFIPAAFAATVIFPTCLFYQVFTGVGVWGNNHPVMWGLDIVNFIWWVGVAHAGTLISALLFLTRQHWRTTIGRMAEAMTVFSVMMAGLYPAIHVGRAWFDWFMFPVPNSNGLWPQFKSPLMWDVFAVNTYLMVSSLFWFMGMIPDFAVLRDRSTTRIRKTIFSFLAMGWTGSARQWHHYEKAYVVLCGLCTLLVFTVSSIVGLDFCTAQLAGWHATIFPLYFVIGAVFCGFGMMLVILIPLRKWCGLETVITKSHIDKVAKLTLVSGLIIDYIYLMEFFIAWYSGDPYERWVFGHRLFGHTYMIMGWILIGVNVCVTQLLWFKKSPLEPCAAVHHRPAHQLRHVERTLCHRRRLAVSGFSAGELGQIHADDLGHRPLHRHARHVFHAVSAVREIPADDRHFRSQRRHARGRPASSARRREKGGWS